MPTEETILLLWGVPIPPTVDSGRQIAERLISLCESLGEDCDYRSEPDVLTDFGRAGLLIVEVKYESSNSRETQMKKFSKYLSRTSAFADPDAILSSRLYELARD